MELKEQRERKNKSKVTKKMLKKSEIKKSIAKYYQERKRVTYTNEERMVNSNVKKYEKLGKI